jgi:hypothetical protein
LWSVTEHFEPWPRLMTAEIAAAYVGERSVQAFRRSVGRLWPKPIIVPGKGQRWTREKVDEAIDGLSHDPDDVESAADVL